MMFGRRAAASAAPRPAAATAGAPEGLPSAATARGALEAFRAAAAATSAARRAKGRFVAPGATIPAATATAAATSGGREARGLGPLRALRALRAGTASPSAGGRETLRLGTLRAAGAGAGAGGLRAGEGRGLAGALGAAADLFAELVLQRLGLELLLPMFGVETHLLELGSADGRLDVIVLAVERHVGDDAGAPPMVAAPERRTDVECRPEAPHRPDRPPLRIPEERCIGRRPIAHAENDHRVVDRHTDHIGLDRLYDVDHVRPRPRITGRRRLLPDLQLLAALEVAGGIGLGAQRLHRARDVVGLRQKSLAELLGPIELVVHHRQHLRHRGEPLDARIPGLLLHGVLEVLTLEARVVLGPAGRTHHFHTEGQGGEIAGTARGG